MKIASLVKGKLLATLISGVIGVLLAILLAASVFDIFSFGLRRQLTVLTLLWCGSAILCYILLTFMPAPLRTRLSLPNPGLSTVLRKIFLAAFFLFPISLILYQQILEFFKILWSGQTSDFIGWLPLATDNRTFFISVFVLTCSLILIVFFVVNKLRVRFFLNSLPDVWYILFILLLSLAIRLPIIHLINTQPISDFGIINADALSLAHGGQPTHMYVATHVVLTMIYGFVYQLFGSDLGVIKIFHAAVYGLSGVSLYAAGKLIFESKVWATVVAILLVSWPSLAVYSNVLTPEHLFILVECALLFAVAYLFKKSEPSDLNTGNRHWVQLLLWSIIVGFLIGLLGMFRPFSELFLTALIFTLTLYTRNLKTIVVILFCIFTAFWLVRDIPNDIAGYYKNKFGNIRPCNLLVGLNVEASGQYNTEDHDLCSKLRTELPDETAFTKTIMQIVWDRLLQEKKDLMLFVNEKFAILWTNSNGILYWAVQLVQGGNQEFILDTIQKVNLMDFAVMFLIMIVNVVGAVIAFFKDIKPALFFCLMAFFGFNLMEIPFELQTRYRTVIMPLFIFFACWTFAALSTSIIARNQDTPQPKNS